MVVMVGEGRAPLFFPMPQQAAPLQLLQALATAAATSASQAHAPVPPQHPACCRSPRKLHRQRAGCQVQAGKHPGAGRGMCPGRADRLLSIWNVPSLPLAAKMLTGQRRTILGWLGICLARCSLSGLCSGLCPCPSTTLHG